MRERALQFGPGRRLIGLLSLPAQPVAGAPAVILPNTGFEHRVGPNRLHVHLARAIAAESGLPVLRMDLSGLGDSGSATDLGRHDAVEDLRSAMDELQRIGIAQGCIPLGLCSGGNDAHQFAKADSRVVAAAFLDHYLYPTIRSRHISIAQKLSDPKRIMNFLERKIRELTPAEGEDFRGEDALYFQQPDQAEFCADIDGFIARRLPLFFLFTGEYQHLYNYPEQLLDACPSLQEYPLHHLHYFADADHTFTRAQMRVQLCDAVIHWLQQMVTPQVSAPPRPANRAPQPAPRGIASAANT